MGLGAPCAYAASGGNRLPVDRRRMGLVAVDAVVLVTQSMEVLGQLGGIVHKAQQPGTYAARLDAVGFGTGQELARRRAHL